VTISALPRRRRRRHPPPPSTPHSTPTDQRNGLARFLEAKGLLQEALDIATDQDYRCVCSFCLEVCDVRVSFCFGC
jgi:hypothetical protein